jgi:hypothetical protein
MWKRNLAKKLGNWICKKWTKMLGMKSLINQVRNRIDSTSNRQYQAEEWIVGLEDKIEEI